MTRRAALPSPYSDGAFATRAARADGVTRNRLEASDLERPHRGVRVPTGAHPLPPQPTPRDTAMRRLRLALHLVRDGLFFSHTSAAIIWGLPLPLRLFSAPDHVSVQWPRRAPRLSGITGHALRRPRVVNLDGWCVQAPADAWCELAAALTLDELVAAGDALFYRQRKLVSRDRLAAAIRRWGGKPGGSKLREAFELIRENAESAKETEWRLILVRAGFPEPEVNYHVYGPDGELVAIIDLALPQYRTGIDYEGRHHAENPEQFARDGRRYNALLALDWYDIKVMAGMDVDSILADLRRRLLSRGWRP